MAAPVTMDDPVTHGETVLHGVTPTPRQIRFSDVTNTRYFQDDDEEYCDENSRPCPFLPVSPNTCMGVRHTKLSYRNNVLPGQTL
jgi:hypothetical protein